MNTLKAACLNNFIVFLYSTSKYGVGKNFMRLKLWATLLALPMTGLTMGSFYTGKYFHQSVMPLEAIQDNRSVEEMESSPQIMKEVESLRKLVSLARTHPGDHGVF